MIGKLRPRSRQRRRRLRRVAGVRDQLINSGSFTTQDGRAHDIFPTGIELDAGYAIRDWVAEEGAVSTIETGLAYAISTLFICEGLLLAGHPDAHHIAFDPYQSGHYSNAGRQIIEEAGLADLVEVHDQDSKVGLPKLVEQNRRFDLGFVDGDHLFDGVLMDLVFLNTLVRPGGIVIIDDLYLPAVARASRFATTNLGWASEQEDVGGEGGMTVFRTPRVPRVREWDHYVDF
jgi:predicted O-methyltransferase YrrM